MYYAITLTYRVPSGLLQPLPWLITQIHRSIAGDSRVIRGFKVPFVQRILVQIQ